jgi:ATP-dependent helicase/nuclease subunit A
MRNARGREGVYKSALDSMGIPSCVADDTSFFLNSEVLLALCLLNSIDNPRRDIYLAGLLVSPLYSFTSSELALIRAEGADTLFDSLVSYTDIHSFDKGRRFISAITRYRILSEGMPTDELMSLLFSETGLLAIASEHGSRENLMLLYENARKFESGSYRGLYNFITYINGVIDRKNSFDKREAPDTEGTVKIITAHSSKGLEYPIVFFVGAEESFNRSRGAAPRFVYKEGFGIGLYARTPSGLGLVANPTKAIINEYIKRKSLEEEARVLYVALTRARERLYVIAAPKKSREDFLEEISVKREYLSDYSVYSLSSFAELILASGSFKTYSTDEFCKLKSKESDDLSDALPMSDRAISVGCADDISVDELVKRFTYEYPDARRTRIPEKVSVSKLVPNLFDTSDEETVDFEALATEQISDQKKYMPAFISGDTGDSKAKGIATHLFLQFCDLERLLGVGAREELKILTEKKYLSERDSGLVRIKEVEKFRSSRLFSDMRSAEKIWRELRFNVKLPCEMFATEFGTREELMGEEVLVQGVIDCLILDTDGDYHLVYYKTDRLSSEEMSDRSKAEEKLRASHSRQLGYYAEAVKIMFGKYPKTVEVYSLPLGDTVDVKIERKDYEKRGN